MATKSNTYIFLVFAIFSIETALCNIEIVDNAEEGSFRIYYNDVLVIYHHAESFPAIEVGVGTFEAHDHFGNWRVNDTCRRKAALDLYQFGKLPVKYY